MLRGPYSFPSCGTKLKRLVPIWSKWIRTIRLRMVRLPAETLLRFNSYEFLFAFLPVVVVGYFAIARLSAFAANAFLAGASVFFYAWWRLDFVWILLASIAANYFFGHKLSRDAA